MCKWAELFLPYFLGWVQIENIFWDLGTFTKYPWVAVKMSKTHKALLQVCEYEIKLDLELSTAATIKSWVYTQDESARKAVDGGNQNNFAKTDCLLCRNGHFKKCQVVWRLENVEDLNCRCHIQAVVQTLIHWSTHAIWLKKNRASNEGKFHSFLMCRIWIYNQK